MTTRATLGLLASAAMVAAVSAPALAAEEPETDAPVPVDLIEGLDWSLARLLIDGDLVELPGGVTVTLRLEGGTATGNGGCNGYFASYELDGNALVFSDIGSTEMFCPDTSEIEQHYFATLAAVTGGFSTGGSLVLAGSDGEPILEYLPADSEPIPTDGIEGLTWQLQSLAQTGSGELLEVPADIVVTMRLEAGVASGGGGCNGWSADYRLEGAGLTFGPVASTTMACSDPVMEIEGMFLTQLASVSSWASDGGSVTLHGADGAELARFLPATAG